MFIYGLEADLVGDILGTHERTVRRWLHQFEATGAPGRQRKEKERSARWPSHVIQFVEGYVAEHPCFLSKKCKMNCASDSLKSQHFLPRQFAELYDSTLTSRAKCSPNVLESACHENDTSILLDWRLITLDQTSWYLWMRLQKMEGQMHAPT